MFWIDAYSIYTELASANGMGAGLLNQLSEGSNPSGGANYRGINFDGEVLPLKQRELGSNPRYPTNLYNKWR